MVLRFFCVAVFFTENTGIGIERLAYKYFVHQNVVNYNEKKRTRRRLVIL